MYEFQYVAQSESGAIERGQISGATPSDAQMHLSNRGLRLIGISRLPDCHLLLNKITTSFGAIQFRPLRAIDIELLLQQLSVLLESGLELTQSLHDLSRQGSMRRQQPLCVRLAVDCEQGKSFAVALEESRSFPPVVTQLVRVGEKTGELATTLQRASEFMEKRRQTTGNLISALAYPLIVAFSASSVAIYLVGWAIPKLEVFLTALGRDLPAMTQSLLDASHLFRQFGVHGVVGLVAALLAISILYAWNPGRYRIDQLLLRTPLIGPMLQMIETHQLASSLALMLRSGMFLPDALTTAALLHRNQYLAALVTKSSERLALGHNLAGSLGEPAFAPMLSCMIAIGERTGDLPKALERVSYYYGMQVDTKIKRVSKLIEPAIIVFVGGIVGYVYVAFFIALLSAGGNFK